MYRSNQTPLRTLDADPVAYILHTLCGVKSAQPSPRAKLASTPGDMPSNGLRTPAPGMRGNLNRK